jgi:hypothetical protein
MYYTQISTLNIKQLPFNLKVFLDEKLTLTYQNDSFGDSTPLLERNRDTYQYFY